MIFIDWCLLSDENGIKLYIDQFFKRKGGLIKSEKDFQR